MLQNFNFTTQGLYVCKPKHYSQEIQVFKFVCSRNWNERRGRYQYRIQGVWTEKIQELEKYAQSGKIQEKLLTHKIHCNN